MRPPHVNISGYAGAGKTTISSLLAARHKTLWIPRATSRPRREGESLDREYVFVTEEGFAEMKTGGKFIPATIHLHHVEEDRRIYHTAVLMPEIWPKPEEDTGLCVSVFGSKAPLVKMAVPEMINIILLLSDEELKKRLETREGAVRRHLLTNWMYRRDEIEKDFDHVVQNDGPAEETVKKIEEIAGLRSCLSSCPPLACQP